MSKTTRVNLLLSLCTAIVLISCSEQSATTKPTIQFASDIEAFLKEDAAHPPPKGAILFIGSSIFRQWKNLKEQMAPLPVFNRAFGGSRTHDVLFSMDKIVLPYSPKIIVYYCGSNDINAGENPTDITDRFKEFVGRVNARLSETRVYYVSINRAPQKQMRWSAVDSTNTLVQEFCRSHEKLVFIDVNPALFDNEGNPKYELYREDMLHFKDEAYEKFAAIIKPVIDAAWKGMK